jgi:hypothetical protein
MNGILFETFFRAIFILPSLALKKSMTSIQIIVLSARFVNITRSAPTEKDASMDFFISYRHLSATGIPGIEAKKDPR